MPQRMGYHKKPRPAKIKKVSRPLEKQLQLPLQPFFRQFEKKQHNYRWYHWFFAAVLFLALIVLATVLSSVYYHRQYSAAASNVTIKVKEYTPVAPQTIEDIIDQQEIAGSAPLPETSELNEVDVDEQNLSNEQVYDLYEEKLPEENHVAIAEEQVPPTDTKPSITIVIDDMGISTKRTKDISSLAYPITASFLTYANNLNEQIANSVASGQEIMAHLPMEPHVMQNFTAEMLTTSMSSTEVKETLQEMLNLFPHITAVNNHMGSKFTEDKFRMSVVMKELAKRNLIFLDSKTTSHSVGPEEAERYGVKLLERNVFLDNKDDFDYIMGQLRQTEEIARSKGYAIAIGHPKEQTYLALKAWLPTLEEKGIRLIPLSEMAKAQ